MALASEKWIGLLPPPDTTYFYLVRPVAPNVGSGGANTAGQERVLLCSP